LEDTRDTPEAWLRQERGKFVSIRRCFANVGMLAFVSMTAGCPAPSTYLNAVTSFAGTTSDGVTSLGALPATAATICRKRAVARFLKGPLESGAAPTIKWEAYYAADKQADGTLSWKDYCVDIQQSASNYSALLTVLTSYANALKALAATGTWDGAALNTILAKSGTLAGAKTPAGTALSGAGGFAQQLGSLVEGKYVADKAHDFASSANTSFQAILDALNNFVVAVKRDVVDPSKAERIEAVNALEAKAGVWTTPLDAARIVSFTTYAQSVDDDVTAVDAQIAGYSTLIAKIKSGHQNLVSKPQDDSSAKDVIASATDILNALAQIESAIAGSSSK
jgi:hypothetical protein